MELKLSDIFVPYSDQLHYSKQKLLMLEVRENFISEVAKRLDLTYLENEGKEDNLCFANNEQLRPAFKIFFSKTDVVDYIKRKLQEKDFDISIEEVSFPESADDFWQLAKQ